MQELSIQDGLTGLFNRRHFTTMLEQATTGYTNVSLLMIDIDHFASVKERCGPVAADVVLTTVAATLSRISRADDIIARIGGEEFAILLEGSDPETCAVLAERLRHEIEIISWPDHVQPPHGQLTVSVGCATGAGLAITPVRMLHQADGALFRSKQQGRNRVTMAASGISSWQVDHPSD